MPLLRSLWRQAAAGASWLLVRLVSQAVALVRRGVQQGSAAAAASSSQEQQQQRRRAAKQRQRWQNGGGGGAQGTGAGWAWQP
jgi:hypothetical protein